MQQKYKLTDETIELCGVTLYRIEALRDFGNVKAGDKGGFIQSVLNLSQEGDCWIYDEAKVCGNARVYDNARIFGEASVCGEANVWGEAWIQGNARVWNQAIVCGNASVFGNARIFGEASVCGEANVWGAANVYGKAEVCGNARVSGKAEVCGETSIKSIEDYIVFKNWWSSGRYFTWTRSNNMWKVGCFYGTGEELIHKAYADSEESGKEYERVVRYVASILASK